MITKGTEFTGLTITFNTTEDCNLACKYCYEINKRKKDLSLDTAYKFIDLITDDEDPLGFTKDTNDDNLDNIISQGIILDFIGGDSLMNVSTVESIIEYFLYKVNKSNTEYCKRWRKNWRCNISSNGTLFGNEDVKQFCERWKDNLSLGVSIDGCPEIHDKNRIFKQRGPNGEEIGTMDTILKNWKWYQETFPTECLITKATCAKDSIPFLRKSLEFMHETLGIRYINQNFIMEDMHLSNEDYILLDEQLKLCVQYVLEHNDELFWSMLDKTFFADHRIPEDGLSKCGSGSMPCLGINGKIYPCFRWAPHTQTNKTRDLMVVGDVDRGLYNKEAFIKVRHGGCYNTCSKEERCKTCEFSSACAYCIGGCFAEYGDFVRTTHICEITKMQCKWSKVYWNEYNKLKGLPLEYDEKYLLKNVKEWTPEYIGTNKGF